MAKHNLGKLPGILLVLVGIVLPTMTQVGPNDAERNFCAWLPGAADNCLGSLSPSFIWAISAVAVGVGAAWLFWPTVVRIRQGTTRWMATLESRSPVVRRSEGRTATWPRPDYDKWGDRKQFRLVDLAYLWEDTEPTGYPLPEHVKARFDRLFDAIKSKSLAIRDNSDLREMIVDNYDEIVRGKPRKANPEWIVDREAARSLAFNTAEKPPFLFPKERVGSTIQADDWLSPYQRRTYLKVWEAACVVAGVQPNPILPPIAMHHAAELRDAMIQGEIKIEAFEGISMRPALVIHGEMVAERRGKVNDETQAKRAAFIDYYRKRGAGDAVAALGG